MDFYHSSQSTSNFFIYYTDCVMDKICISRLLLQKYAVYM